MNKLIYLLVLINGIGASAQTSEENLWDFQKPQGGYIKLQDLLGENYYHSEEKLILAYNGSSLQDGFKTEKGLRYVYFNHGFGTYKHLSFIELNIVDSVIIQVCAYVLKDDSYYQSWKKDMQQEGFKTSDMYIKMEGKMDEYFNENVHADYVMSKDLDPNMILYSIRDKGK